MIIDHGQRLFTVYMHLSKIEVALGEKAAKGDELGLSGKSGRVTGPHPHMGVRWNGAYLDPGPIARVDFAGAGRRPGCSEACASPQGCPSLDHFLPEGALHRKDVEWRFHWGKRP